MVIRPAKDSQRVLICAQVDAYMASGSADADVIAFYNRGFAAAQARFTAARLSHRSKRATLKSCEEATSTADDNNDEALRKLSSHTQMKHGIEGLRTLEGYWGGIPRSHLTGLPRPEQARRVSDFLMMYDAGVSLKLQEEYVEEVRSTHSTVQACLVAESQARSALRYAREELETARAEFDSLWTALARFGIAVLGDGAAVLVPELKGRREKGEGEE